jgi:hypothetical protein
MSLAILVRERPEQVIIVGGTHATLPLVAGVADYMQTHDPAIYATAFEALEWNGDVYLSDLNSQDFKKVVEATRAAYQEFLNACSEGEAEEEHPGIYRQWQEYLAALDSDPRLNDASR